MAKHELTITRIFNAPRDLVWKAWTDGEMMKKWTSPSGFKSLSGTMDLRIGGRFSSGMESPQGEKHVAYGIYKEITPPRRLVFSHGWEGEENVTTVTVIFEEENGKTKMTFHQEGFDSVESRNGHEGGWSESFDKLDVLLIN